MTGIVKDMLEKRAGVALGAGHHVDEYRQGRWHLSAECANQIASYS